MVAVLNYSLSVALAWLLAPADFGLVSATQAVLLLAALVLQSGFPRGIALIEARRAGPMSESADAVLRGALVGNFCFGALLGVGFVLIDGLVVEILPRGGTWLPVIVAVTFPAFAVNAVVKGVLHGRRRFGAFGLVQVVEVFVKCFVAIVLVGLMSRAGVAVALGFLVGAVIATAVAIWRVPDVLPRWGTFTRRARSLNVAPVFIGTVGFALFATIDLLGLQVAGQGFGVTAATLAVYQVGVLLARAPYYVAEALSDAVFPFVARDIDTPAKSHAWFGTGARWTVLLVTPLELVLVLRPDLFLDLLFPDQYATAAGLVRLIGIGTLGMIVMGGCGKALQALGEQTRYARAMVMVLLLETLLLTVLVPRLAAVGAAMAFLLSAWSGAVVLLVAYYRRQRAPLPPWHSLLSFALASSMLAPITLLPTHLGSLVVGAALVSVLAAYMGAVLLLGLVSVAEVKTAVGPLLSLLRDGVRRIARLSMKAGGAACRSLRTLGQTVMKRPRLLGLILFAPAAAVLLARLTLSPDTQYDEVVYTRAAQEVGANGNLTWSTEPVLVHPPLYFLVQGAWLGLLGLTDAPLPEAVQGARYVTAALAAANAVMLGALAYALMPCASSRRRLLLGVAAAAVAVVDPVLLRYGRLAVIEPMALCGALATLLASWAAQRWSAARHVMTVGLLSGLSLLVKEVTIFLLLTPLVFGLLSRDLRYTKRAGGAMVVAVGCWLIFPLWAIELGVGSRFAEVKLLTLERLLGLLQVTGWNRPGVSFLDAVTRSTSVYLSSYLILAGGAIALLWLFFRHNAPAPTYVLSMLMCGYGFGAYIVAQGTLNEQFFVYIVAPAIIGCVAGVDALAVTLRQRAHSADGGAAMWLRLASVSAPVGAALVVGTAAASYGAQYVATRQDGMRQMAQFVGANYPRCSAFNSSGDEEKYAFALGGRTVTTYRSGATALAHGVHLFFLNGKDVRARYSPMTPELANWIQEHGRRVVHFPSRTYEGVELWEVPASQYDATADQEGTLSGIFVHTVGSRCGGFSVTDANGAFLYRYRDLGGKQVVGAPVSRVWRARHRFVQAFNGALLRSETRGDVSPMPVEAAPIVGTLAQRAPARYRREQLPPVRYSPDATLTREQVLDRLNDQKIAQIYLRARPQRASDRQVRRALDLFGPPIGPATRMRDGAVRQAFANVVFERTAANPALVRLAPVGRIAVAALAMAPAAALRPEPSPAYVVPKPPAKPSDVAPFVRSLGALVAAFSLLAGAALYWGRRSALAPSIVTTVESGTHGDKR